MTDHLFDPAPFGGVRAPRPKATKPEVDEVKVRPPWVVFRSSRGLPTAHRVTDLTRHGVYGGLIADCGATALPLELDGEPMARACPRCRGAS